MNISNNYWKAAVNLLVAAGIALVFILLVPKALVFLTPFVAGWIIALIASPVVRFLEKRLKIVRKAGSAVVIVLVLGLVVLAGYLVIARLIEEGIGFFQSLPALYESIEGDFQEISVNLQAVYDRMPQMMQNGLSAVGDSLQKFLSGMMEGQGASSVTAAAGNLAKNIPLVVISIIMTVLSSYLFVAQKDEIAAFFHKYTPAGIKEKWNIVWNSLKSAVGGYFKAQLKIMIVVFLILIIGFSFLQIPYAALIALLTAFLDFLPFFGTGIVMAPWAAIKFLSQDYKFGFGLLIIWGVSQLVRQLIQPKLVGDSVGMRPIPTLFLLYIGFRVAGVLGMILAVPLGMILANLYKAGLFENTKKSIEILVNGINKYRKL